jgi:hypothetical protein
VSPAKKDSVDAATEAVAAKFPDAEEWGEVGAELSVTVIDPEQGPVTGRYLGFTEVELTDSDGQPRMTKRHTVEAAVGDGFNYEAGETIGVWGSHDLDRKLELIPSGTPVRIEYRRTIDIDGGARRLKIYRVLAPKAS